MMFLSFSYAVSCSQCTLYISPENIRKLYGFPFSGSREKVHWKEWVNKISVIIVICNRKQTN